MAEYLHVPGFTVNVNDGGLVIPITASTATETLLILGPATAGSTDNPVFIGDQSGLASFSNDADLVYGTEGNRNFLTTSWKQAYDAGCKNIYLMRLDDSQNSIEITAEALGAADAVKTTFVLAHSGVVLDSLVVKKDDVVVSAVDYTYNDATKTITFAVAPAAGAMTADYTYMTPETKAKSLFMSLHEALNLLTNVDIFDHIAVVGVYSDDAVTLDAGDVATLGAGYVAGPADIVGELNKFVVEQIANNNEVLGYIGRKPLGKLAPTLAEVRTYVDGAVDLADKYSGFVSVVGGIDLAFSCGFDYADSGVVAYAALATTLLPHSATTNKQVKGARLIYNPTLSMLEALGDKKYVSFRRRNAIVTPTLDVTAAADNSDFVLLSTARILLAAVKLTREVCEPFIGEGADTNSINAMETALQKTYKNMVSAKSILAFDFAIVMTPQDFLNGRTTISLDVVPCLERRRIRLDITAKAQL